VELRGFEPLTPCMPYTDLQPHHEPIQPLRCGHDYPLVTVVDRE